MPAPQLLMHRSAPLDLSDLSRNPTAFFLFEMWWDPDLSAGDGHLGERMPSVGDGQTLPAQWFQRRKPESFLAEHLISSFPCSTPLPIMPDSLTRSFSFPDPPGI